MFVGITNTPRDYAWGSTTAIAGLLGTPETGAPQAELWLGAHPGSPSVILDPAAVGGHANLAEWIAADPAAALGERTRLPFLLKVLAAASPLSLQAHPTLAQAAAGFARENAEGVPLDAAYRNYKDDLHKPELIFALSDRFDALCGFRSVALVRASIEVLRSAADSDADDAVLAAFADRLVDDAALQSTFEWLISRSTDGAAGGVDTLVETVVRLAALEPAASALEFSTVTALAAEYPGDPGIVISLLLNRVALRRGEVLYLPAGNIHAYLFGLGIELMASSDNVLRGGLTPKHVDVPELLTVLDFTPVAVPYLLPRFPVPGVALYVPDVPDFVLAHVQGDDVDAVLPLDGPAIAIVTSGTFALAGANADLDGTAGAAGSIVTLSRGDSVYVTPDEASLHITGAGELFLATTGR